MIKALVFVLFLLSIPLNSTSWGFFAHKEINRLAVFTLPPEMIGFYKHNIQYLTENAVNPDKRRYAVKGEAPRHYIDIDIYGDSAVYKMPRYWKEAVETYSEDTLQAYGIAPWHINFMKYQLTNAMATQDTKNILRLSAEIGHYIGDANVPLHTTENYNGQLTNQHGIHGFWESRLPELFFEEYDFFVGRATYLDNSQLAIWDGVIQAHEALDSVLSIEMSLNTKFSEDKKFAYEQRGASVIKVYSFEYSKAYHDALNGMVERQMRRSVKMVGDFWYTCWVDAGQPDLNMLIDFQWSEDEISRRKEAWKSWQKQRVTSREHESGNQ